MAVHPPDGYIPFSKLTVGQQKIKRLWGNLALTFVVTGVIVLLVMKYHYLFAICFTLSLSLMMVYSKKLRFWGMQQWISVGTAHPWFEGTESHGESGVAIFSSDNNWIVLPLEGRLWKLSSEDSTRVSLMLNTNDDEKIGYWNESDVNSANSSELIEIINMALALRDAQNRGPDTTDPFEKSREREYDESQLLDREWDSVEPGQFDIQLGALARKITGRFSSDEDDEME